jgi:chromosome segregation ATPase
MPTKAELQEELRKERGAAKELKELQQHWNELIQTRANEQKRAAKVRNDLRDEMSQLRNAHMQEVYNLTAERNDLRDKLQQAEADLDGGDALIRTLRATISELQEAFSANMDALLVMASNAKARASQIGKGR